MRRKQLPVGSKYGRLVVQDNKIASRSGRNRMICICKCECGTVVEVMANSLQIGNTNSCGCYVRDVLKNRATHGHTRKYSASRTYKAWSNMINRCENQKVKHFKNYGGRGISVCNRWHDFANFLADMGECPNSFMIERLDNDGNYEPGNCRWATTTEQANNKRNSRWLVLKGEKKTLAQWAQQSNLPYMKLFYRLRKGLTLQDALSMPYIKGEL